MLVLFWARAVGRISVATNAKLQQKARGNMMAMVTSRDSDGRALKKRVRLQSNPLVGRDSVEPGGNACFEMKSCVLFAAPRSVALPGIIAAQIGNACFDVKR